ncbi:protein UPSTREAM OF FLC isoform X2 [Olea europaea var. sylvestris]|uniref:protein UPSTREAM OF FLC isoform X2 n=1 Tax=Olea europaea var. sylvestris TaxID=158386 RepID=UPI000C1D60BB|nr:protein UPSTREAM OF FLC isoform X2 [Olea europaea var. sylvestris]
MEGRMKKYRQVSPERAKVWTEKSPKYQYKQQQHDRKVPVVYYLCRNRQLEHPHFIEVPISSPDGLYLRDVMERLNVLRGRGMASVYSWSCKRSYKNGYVWHDLCEDDLILPAHGNEYVLKGSELFDEPDSGQLSPAGNVALQNLKALPEPPSSRSRGESSSSSSLNGRTTKSSQDDDLSPPIQRPRSLALSPQSSVGKTSSSNAPLGLTEYKVYQSNGLTDAFTQTEEHAGTAVRSRDTCTRGVSTDDGSLETERNEPRQNQVPQVKETSEICRDLVSPPTSISSTSSTSGKTDTLESLIRADASKLNSFRILEEEELRMPSNTKFKASNVLMQLITCGSIAVKDHKFGLIPTYKPSFSHSEFPSPLFSTSVMLGELDCLSENPRLMGVRLEDKEYFSGGLVETSVPTEEVTIKRSLSYNADRTNKQFDSLEDEKEPNSTHSKCIPRSIKASLSKQPRCESMRSPLSEGRRISSDRVDSSRNITFGTASGGSKRIEEPFSEKNLSKKVDSFRDEKENVIKIEES